MKKIIASCILVAPLIALSDEAPFPSTMKGIQIVPLLKQQIPVEMKQEIIAKRNEENNKGYRETNAENVQFLLNIKRIATQELKAASVNDVYDTHLKSNFSSIKLAFPFKGISVIENKDVIGYAAIGSYKEGWTGIREFFSNPTLGNCAYSYMGIKAVQLAEETTEYLVNKKPSNKVIEGNLNLGFLYTLNWYTNDSMHTLECANKSFNSEIMSKMIKLANIIDKN